MICPNCGEELPEGLVYCSKCGQEVQVVSAVDDLEEEILREFMDEDHQTAESVDNGSNAVTEAKNRRKKKRTRNLIIVLVVIAAAAAAFGVVRYRQNHSEDYLLRRAQEEYVQKDYDRAIRYLDRLLALDADNEEGLLLEAEVYAAIPDYDQAEELFYRVIELDPDSVDAYDGILEVLYVQGKIDNIRDLKHSVTNAEILALFDNYLPPDPEIKVPGGNYSEFFTVEIRAPKKGLSIYYTLDGSTPTKEDFLYSGPIEINQQGKITLTAVCMDEDGIYSDPVSETYQVDLVKPDMPTAAPGGGQYSSQISVTVTVPSGTTVYYTWDNSTPDVNSARYTGPITIPEGNNILSLIAIDANGMKSEVQRYNYIYYPVSTTESIPDTSPEDDDDYDEDEDEAATEIEPDTDANEETVYGDGSEYEDED